MKPEIVIKHKNSSYYQRLSDLEVGTFFLDRYFVREDDLHVVVGIERLPDEVKVLRLADGRVFNACGKSDVYVPEVTITAKIAPKEMYQC